MSNLSRGHRFDAGVDIMMDDDVIVKPHESKSINLHVANVNIASGMAGFLFIRSKYAHLPLILQNPPIDAHYTGDLHAFVHNVGDDSVVLLAGTAYFQLVIVPILCPSTIGQYDVELKSDEDRADKRDTTR